LEPGPQIRRFLAQLRQTLGRLGVQRRLARVAGVVGTVALDHRARGFFELAGLLVEVRSGATAGLGCVGR